MSTSRKLIGIASTLIILAFAQIGSAADDAASTGGRLLAMDDAMKPKPPDTTQPATNMGQPQQTGPDRMMMDDRMRMQSPPMKDQDNICQGSACQNGRGGMWTRMEKMMRGQIGGMPGTGAAGGAADVTERMEGRIAFLKAELQITDKQMADWNVLAGALRSGRHHLLEARKLAILDDKTPSAERLERYERHLTERLEAVKSARAGFVRLYANLDDAQKGTADAILVPLIATF